MATLTSTTQNQKFHQNIRCYTPAPDNIITLYNRLYDQKTQKIIYTNIIGYLLVEKERITTLGDEKNII